MTDKQVKAIIEKCYDEFCNIVGDSPAGCDACPYSQYNTNYDAEECAEAYFKNAMKAIEVKK